VQRCKK